MNKLPVYISEPDFEEYILPHLSHKLNYNRLEVSYRYLFNTVLCVLKSGCFWQTLKPDNQKVIVNPTYAEFRLALILPNNDRVTIFS